jgi:hypothetical protein
MVGGLLISTVGTLVLVPSVLALLFDLQALWARRRGRAAPVTAVAERVEHMVEQPQPAGQGAGNSPD